MSGDDSGSSDGSGPGQDPPREDGPDDDPADESDGRDGPPDEPRDDHDAPRDGHGDAPRDGHRDRPGGAPGSDPRRETGDPVRRRDGDDRADAGGRRDRDHRVGDPGGPGPGGHAGDQHGEPRRADRPGGPQDGDRPAGQGPRAPPRRRSSQERGGGIRFWIHRFRTAETGPLMIAREVLSSVLMVAAVGFLLFAISGVWPPMVAVQSGSMEPHMHRGDLVFVVDEHRFADDVAVEGTGVAPHAVAEGDGYVKFGNHGDVIIYEPDGSTVQDPIIHRARFWVEKGENWYDEADKDYVRADSCAELTYCPAPNSGFITKGDNNPTYDQAQRMTRPVKPEWITGKAMVRIPALGYIRLIFSHLGHATAGALGAVFLGSGLGLRRGRIVPRGVRPRN